EARPGGRFVVDDEDARLRVSSDGFGALRRLGGHAWFLEVERRSAGSYPAAAMVSKTRALTFRGATVARRRQPRACLAPVPSSQPDGHRGLACANLVWRTGSARRTQGASMDHRRYLKALKLDEAEVQSRRAFFELTDEDLRRLAGLKPFAEKCTDAI